LAKSARCSAEKTAASSTFHARDLHLVLGSAPDGNPVRFRVTIDGQPPGDNHGADTDAEGQGVVAGQRLYQLIRQSGTVADRAFEIWFLDPGFEAYVHVRLTERQQQCRLSSKTSR
jgi:hypothetical protein